MNDPLEYFGSLAIQVLTVSKYYNFGPCLLLLAKTKWTYVNNNNPTLKTPSPLPHQAQKNKTTQLQTNTSRLLINPVNLLTLTLFLPVTP